MHTVTQHIEPLPRPQASHKLSNGLVQTIRLWPEGTYWCFLEYSSGTPLVRVQLRNVLAALEYSSANVTGALSTALTYWYRVDSQETGALESSGTYWWHSVQLRNVLQYSCAYWCTNSGTYLHSSSGILVHSSTAQERTGALESAQERTGARSSSKTITVSIIIDATLNAS